MTPFKLRWIMARRARDFLSIISFVQVLKRPKLPATKKAKLSQMDNLAIYKTVNRMALLLYSNFNIYNRSKKIWRV